MHSAKLSPIGVGLSKSKALSKHRQNDTSLDLNFYPWIQDEYMLRYVCPGYQVIPNSVYLLPICRANICPSVKQILFSDVIYLFLYCKWGINLQQKYQTKTTIFVMTQSCLKKQLTNDLNKYNQVMNHYMESGC